MNKIIGHNLSKCRTRRETNTGKTVLSKPVIVQYKFLLLHPRKLTSLIDNKNKFLKRRK